MFNFKPLPPNAPKFDIKGQTKRLRAALEEEGKDHQKLLRLTIRTWKGAKPRFSSTTTVSRDTLAVVTAPRGGYPPRGRSGSAKWWYLEEGTRIRWALMQSRFVPKTRRGLLSSVKGRGGAIIVGRKAMSKRNIRPRPGIRARNWRAEVNRRRSRKFKGRLKREFDFVARNTITPKSLRR